MEKSGLQPMQTACMSLRYASGTISFARFAALGEPLTMTRVPRALPLLEDGLRKTLAVRRTVLRLRSRPRARR